MIRFNRRFSEPMRRYLSGLEMHEIMENAAMLEELDEVLEYKGELEMLSKRRLTTLALARILQLLTDGSAKDKAIIETLEMHVDDPRRKED